MHIEDSDQTVHLRRLIWVFNGPACQLVLLTGHHSSFSLWAAFHTHYLQFSGVIPKVSLFISTIIGLIVCILHVLYISAIFSSSSQGLISSSKSINSKIFLKKILNYTAIFVCFYIAIILNTPCYNTNLDIRQSCCGSQIFLPCSMVDTFFFDICWCLNQTP